MATTPPEPEFLTVEDNLDWQRGDIPVGLLGDDRTIKAGNTMGQTISTENDEDAGVDVE